jgi:Domain of unknown function (DUF4159)
MCDQSSREDDAALCSARVALSDAAFEERKATMIHSQSRSVRRLVGQPMATLVALFLLATCSAAAAFQWGGGGLGRRGRNMDDRNGVPVWDINKDFAHDCFTFARVRWQGEYGGWAWQTDYPDADLNFSLRLQQLTSIKVNPHSVFLDLTDPKIYDYPFLYMIEPGRERIRFSTEEASALRRYCMNGGFLMVDDFWGDAQYFAFHRAIKQVFPEREVQDVPLEHEIFHLVYDLKEKPQVPSIHQWRHGSTNEYGHGGNTDTPNYRAIYNDDGRIMVFICHNTDLGDGWEREGEDKEYFEEFAVKKSYPLGINIVTYAMTH